MNNSIIEYYVGLNNKSKILLFVGVFLAYYLLFYNTANTAQNLFIVILLFILSSLNSMNKEDNKLHTVNIDTFINKIEEMVKTHDTPEMMLKTVYRIHKPLKDLRYIRTSRELQETLYNLRFLLIYDKEDFIDIIVMLEYFIKIHFNVMIGKYDVETYYAILQDIRKEALNSLKSSFFNLPEHSTTFYSTNLLGQMQQECTRVQAITYKYMKILSHKYQDKLKHDNYNSASGLDRHRDNMYDMVY
jgi:hypothetical protein